MNDDELIDRVAHLWIACGGDADGVAWCWRSLQKRVAQLQSTQQEDEGVTDDTQGLQMV